MHERTWATQRTVYTDARNAIHCVRTSLELMKRLQKHAYDYKRMLYKTEAMYELREPTNPSQPLLRDWAREDQPTPSRHEQLLPPAFCPLPQPPAPLTVWWVNDILRLESSLFLAISTNAGVRFEGLHCDDLLHFCGQDFRSLKKRIMGKARVLRGSRLVPEPSFWNMYDQPDFVRHTRWVQAQRVRQRSYETLSWGGNPNLRPRSARDLPAEAGVPDPRLCFDSVIRLTQAAQGLAVRSELVPARHLFGLTRLDNDGNCWCEAQKCWEDDFVISSPTCPGPLGADLQPGTDKLILDLMQSLAELVQALERMQVHQHGNSQLLHANAENSVLKWCLEKSSSDSGDPSDSSDLNDDNDPSHSGDFGDSHNSNLAFSVLADIDHDGTDQTDLRHAFADPNDSDDPGNLF